MTAQPSFIYPHTDRALVVSVVSCQVYSQVPPPTQFLPPSTHLTVGGATRAIAEVLHTSDQIGLYHYTEEPKKL